MSEEAEKPKHKSYGKPWTNSGTFNSYEEASNNMSHQIASEPTFDYKIKRTGEGGSKFTIKKRLNPDLHEANLKLEKKISSILNFKKYCECNICYVLIACKH